MTTETDVRALQALPAAMPAMHAMPPTGRWPGEDTCMYDTACEWTW
ncbi:hypothetical protein ABZU32_26050 [Sphaerisporangium sp. NPDC005288]